MTYTNLFFKSNSATSTPNQVTSTTYTEIEGSRAVIQKTSADSDLYYFFSFSTCPYGESYEKARFHVKLQRSNDNFSSNIVDVANCNYNFSTDTGGGSDHLYKNNNVFFIVQNTGNDSLRLAIRSYGSNTRSYLHFTPHYDGIVTYTNKYYYPTLIVKEI